MNLFAFPELFHQVSIYLNDKEKVFLTSCSEITYNLKSLIRLDSEYYLEEINNRYRVKNIIIKDFLLENKTKELLENLIFKGNKKIETIFGDSESIIINSKSKYVKFISKNTNIKLFHNKKIIKKIILYGYSYLAMQIMLNNDDSIVNINKQFIKASKYGYLDVVKLLIKLGADIHTNYDKAMSWASIRGNFSMIKLFIELSTDIHSWSNQAFINASCMGHWDIVKLLTDSGAINRW